METDTHWFLPVPLKELTEVMLANILAYMICVIKILYIAAFLKGFHPPLPPFLFWFWRDEYRGMYRVVSSFPCTFPLLLTCSNCPRAEEHNSFCFCRLVNVL